MSLSVKVAAHPWFRRDDLDILLDVPISIVEATLGANSPPAVAMVREGDFPYYEINPKHIKGTPSFNNARSKNPALIPSNHIELYRKAIADNKVISHHGN